MKMMLVIVGQIITKQQQSKSFEYKIKIIERKPNFNTTLDKEAVPLKYLINFLRFLDLRLIKYKIEFAFLWSKERITFEISI